MTRTVRVICMVGLALAAAYLPVDAGPAPEAPPVGEVVAAAYRASGLDRDPVRGLVRRARIAGLIPWLTVRTGRDTSWQDQLAAGSVSTDGIDHGTTFEVRATWRLDRLVFDGRELQVTGIEAARRRERRRLATRVIRTYFTWKRAIANVTPDAAATTIVDDGPRARAVRAEEAAAELDALTDGWFSEELAGGPKRGHGE